MTNITDKNIQSIKRSIPEGKAGVMIQDGVFRGLQMYVGTRSSTWYLRYFTHEDRERRQKLGSYPLMNRKMAVEVARVIMGKVAIGEDPASKKYGVIFGDVYGEFIKWAADHKKLSTYNGYKNIYDKHVKKKLAKKRLDGIKRADVAALHKSIGGHQANRVLSFISSVYQYAYKNDMCSPEHKPFKHVQRFKEEKRKRYATEEELLSLGKQIAEHLLSKKPSERQFARLISCVLLTGARVDEWRLAEASWITDDFNYLNMPDSKTGAATIAIPEIIKQMLKDAMNETGSKYIFSTGITPISTSKLWSVYREEAGLGDLRMQDLRRTFATYGLSDGSALTDISKVLRHSDTKVTAQVYAHLLDKSKKKTTDNVASILSAHLEGQAAD